MPRSLVSISALLPAPGLADLDGDGKIDLVVGDRATLRQINGKLPGKEAKEALAQW